MSGGALALLHARVPSPPTAVELSALVVANAVATGLRFLLLRSWVFHPGRR